MRRSTSTVLLTLALLAATTLTVSVQSAPLRVLEAGPTGVIQQLRDANEIRVIFSEPMVPLGRVPSNPTPSWIHIAPGIRGTYRWSGTTILIFTPDPAAPLPFATRYTVTLDRNTESAGGRQLGASYQFAFTTPTVKLLSARWARQNDKIDGAVALALTFNQPVRPEDIASHLAVRYERHDWTAPAFTARERARLQTNDPEGLRAFDAKVAATRQVAASTGVVPVRLATNWNRERFRPVAALVVLETTVTPPPESWLRLTLDPQVPSASGAEVPGRAQTSTTQLEDAFFVRDVTCRTECAPSDFNAITFSRPIGVAAFARSLAVRDVTDPSREQPVTPSSPVKGATLADAGFLGLGLDDAGFARQPATRTWQWHVDASLQADDGQTLGYPWIALVATWHERAFSSFGDGHGVWEKDGGPQLPFYARNLQTITQWLTPLSPMDLMPRILSLEKSQFTETPPSAGSARRLGVTPDAVQSHGVDLASTLSPKGTGLVWAAMLDGQPIAQAKPIQKTPKPHAAIVQVTNLGITVKDSPLSTLLFVTRLDDGRPVADAKVTIVNRDNKSVWTGKTKSDGVAMAPALQIRSANPWRDFKDNAPRVSYVATAEKDGDVAYVVSDWDEGIEPWEFGLPSGLYEATAILRGSVFTDRGVYKPGEEVHFKAMLRSDTQTGMRLLADGSPIDVAVTDSRNRQVDRRTVKVNRWSSVDWAWTVPAEGTVGEYSVVARVPGSEPKPANDTSEAYSEGEWLKRVNGSFLVAAYRRPDFRVDATLTAETPVAGLPLHATLDARYLFGSAMSRRPVRWTLTQEHDLSVPAGIAAKIQWKDFRFGYYPDQPRAQNTRAGGAETTLDAGGKLALDLPTHAGVDLAYRYTFEGEVEDVSRQRIANRASVTVYPAPWLIGLRQPSYFADTKTGTTVDVAVVDRDGAPVAGVSVALSLIKIQWNSVRHAEGNGFYTWETETIETPAGQWTVTSGATPFAQAIPVPEGGSYRLRAIAKTADGHSTRTEVGFYGIGEGYTAWQRFDHNRIKFEPERATWKPGEKARLMIQSPWESATALLTVEREGVRQYRQFALTSTQQTVEVPITEADIPNVFVSILLVRGRTSKEIGKDGDDPGKPAFRLGYAELHVEDATKTLGVKVTADRAEYRPANIAKVSVAVTDPLGRGSRSEVTLWAVDYGVLSLTGYETPDVLHSVWADKVLQVTTVDSRQRVISRRVLTPKGASDGGGGGIDGGANGARKDFRPLAFWIGSVETDGNGRATKDVTLPESLTTYRIMAVADDMASRFGSTDAEIRVSKPITLVSALPRFLALGDRASFGAVVSNTTREGGTATVTVRSLDPAILDFENGALTLPLGPGSSEAVRFSATARSAGRARVEMTVTLGHDTDAFQTTLPVLALTPLETTAAFGDTDSRATQPLKLPANLIPGLGGLQVDLASTALVGLGEGVRYLSEYPYDCAEQRASRALGLILAADLGNAFGMARITPAEYRAQGVALLKQLPNYQCSDGGFTFWAGRCDLTSAYLTAYVLDVMKVSGTFGAESDKAVVKDALDYLERELRAPAPTPMPVQYLTAYGASQAYSVRVLTAYGRNQDSNITRLMTMDNRLPVFGLSYLADALADAGDRGPRYQNVVRLITNAMRIEGDQAHIEELDQDNLAWLWNSNARATSIVLEGMVRRGDDPVFVQRMVRWLLAARANGRWNNTQDNIMALRSLVAYYRKFEGDVPDMTATVSIGSGQIGAGTFKGRSTVLQTVQVAMRDVIAKLATGSGDLVLERAGTGRLYYTARMQTATTDPPPAVDRGIRVERRYEKFVETGDSPASTSFAAGDLVRVTLTVTVPKERRYVAVSDSLPAGFEPVDGWFRTTAADLAKDASNFGRSDQVGWQEWWRRGGFDNVEKYDDRVVIFGTRLGEGRHVFSYLVRATTAGTFNVAGPMAEEMYAPEVNGRAGATVVVIK